MAHADAIKVLERELSAIRTKLAEQDAARSETRRVSTGTIASLDQTIAVLEGREADLIGAIGQLVEAPAARQPRKAK